MKLKKDIKFIRFDGDNVKELKTFAGRKVSVIPMSKTSWKMAVIGGRQDQVMLCQGDYLAKHGDKICVIPEDIFKFIMT